MPKPRIRLIVLCATGAITLAGLTVGAEGVASATVTQQLASRAPVGTTIRPAGSVLWGLVSGALPVEARLDAEALAAITRADQVTLGEAVEITMTRQSRFGEVPVTVRLQPTVTDHQLTWTVLSATAAGIELPASRTSRLTPRTKGLDCLSVTEAEVEPTHVAVRGFIPVRPDGSPTCRT